MCQNWSVLTREYGQINVLADDDDSLQPNRLTAQIKQIIYE